MKASAIRHLAGAFNAPRVAAALFERTVQLWDGQTAQQISQFETVLSFGCHRLALSPSGEMCVAAAWQKGKRGGVTCYDAATGAVLWHRTDIRHTQSVRFSAAGNSIWCRLEEGRLQHLSASTGETLDALAGITDVLDSPHSAFLLLETRGHYKIKGPKDFNITPISFALLDACFSPDTLCLNEAGGPMRCVDCLKAEERWRYDPPQGSHVLAVSYRQSDHCF